MYADVLHKRASSKKENLILIEKWKRNPDEPSVDRTLKRDQNMFLIVLAAAQQAIV